MQENIILCLASIGATTVGYFFGTVLFLIIDAIQNKIKRRKGK